MVKALARRRNGFASVAQYIMICQHNIPPIACPEITSNHSAGQQIRACVHDTSPLALASTMMAGSRSTLLHCLVMLSPVYQVAVNAMQIPALASRPLIRPVVKPV